MDTGNDPISLHFSPTVRSSIQNSPVKLFWRTPASPPITNPCHKKGRKIDSAFLFKSLKLIIDLFSGRSPAVGVRRKEESIWGEKIRGQEDKEIEQVCALHVVGSPCLMFPFSTKNKLTPMDWRQLLWLVKLLQLQLSGFLYDQTASLIPWCADLWVHILKKTIPNCHRLYVHYNNCDACILHCQRLYFKYHFIVLHKKNWKKIIFLYRPDLTNKLLPTTRFSSLSLTMPKHATPVASPVFGSITWSTISASTSVPTPFSEKDIWGGAATDRLSSMFWLGYDL